MEYVPSGVGIDTNRGLRCLIFDLRRVIEGLNHRFGQYYLSRIAYCVLRIPYCVFAQRAPET